MWQVGGLQDDEADHANGASSTERWLQGIETLLLGGDERFTAEEVRAAAGVDEAWSQRLWRAIGFPEIPPGVRALTPADREALTQVTALRRAGLGDDDLVNVTRTASLAMARIADAVTAESTMWANVMGATDESSPEHVDPLATFDSLLAYLSRRQLLAAMLWRTATTGDDLDWPNLAVGFADIVGYTELSQQLPGDDIAELVGRFDSVTSDVVADGGGRTVKMIGDAVLFTAETSAGACEIALTLSARLHADRDARFPGIRVGLAWGPVLARFGDVYGPVVNLASRLVAAARPGTVLVGAEIAAFVSDDERFVTRSLRARRLKGLGRVQLHTLRRADP